MRRGGTPLPNRATSTMSPRDRDDNEQHRSRAALHPGPALDDAHLHCRRKGRAAGIIPFTCVRLEVSMLSRTARLRPQNPHVGV